MRYSYKNHEAINPAQFQNIGPVFGVVEADGLYHTGDRMGQVKLPLLADDVKCCNPRDLETGDKHAVHIVHFYFDTVKHMR